MISRPSFGSIPTWTFVIGLLLGASYALFMGPLHTPDEGGHMYRAYLVSEGYCAGVPGIGIPMDYRDLDHRVIWLQLSRRNTGADLLKMVDHSRGISLPVVSLFFAVNLSSCVPYLPAGAAFGLGRVFTASPLTLMYLGRFANLLFYLLMVCIALRLLPDFQLPLAVLVLMPMSLQQAASLSADAVTNAIAFVLTAYIHRLAIAGPPAPLRRADYLLLLAGAVVSGLCKSNAGLLFLVLLIPGVRFPNRRTHWLAVAGCIVLAYGTAAAWQSINRPNGEVHETLKHAAGIYPRENAGFILQHPAVFMNAVLHTAESKGYKYPEEFVAKLGWFDVPLPGWITWIYLLLLVAVAATGHAGRQPQRWQRMLLIGVFLVNVMILYAVVWTTEIPRYVIQTASLAQYGWIPGLQGRYLIPFALLLLLAASGLVRQFHRGWLAVPALALVVVMNGVALRIVWNTFQAHSSTIPNRVRMAFRLHFADTPETSAWLYDNLLVSTRTAGAFPFLVAEGTRHPMPNIPFIVARGYKLPDDVHLISDQELFAIPLAAGGYDGKLVRRPGSSLEDGKVYLVRGDKKHWITDSRWISSNGFKWPDDVNTIPASDLAQIPVGADIPGGTQK